MIGAPVNRYSATAYHEGDHQHMLVRFNGPVNGQSHLAVLGSLMQGLSQHGIRQLSRIKPLMMQQA
jgi:hypothetical protein